MSEEGCRSDIQHYLSPSCDGGGGRGWTLLASPPAPQLIALVLVQALALALVFWIGPDSWYCTNRTHCDCGGCCGGGGGCGRLLSSPVENILRILILTLALALALALLT